MPDLEKPLVRRWPIVPSKDPSNLLKGSFETFESVCCHRVAIRYWDFNPMYLEDDDFKAQLREDGKNHARELISQECCQGELNSLYFDGKEHHEVRGWWRIEE